MHIIVVVGGPFCPGKGAATNSIRVGSFLPL